MQTRTRELLDDVLSSIVQIERYIEGASFEDYLASQMLRDAVERRIIALGEMFIRIRVIDEEIFEAIPESRALVGVRNRLAHGYDEDIDDPTMWRTVHDSLPVLRASIERVIADN